MLDEKIELLMVMLYSKNLKKLPNKEIVAYSEKLAKEGYNTKKYFKYIAEEYSADPPTKARKGTMIMVLNNFIPDICMVYKLFHKGVLVYIGSTVNIARRLASHMNTKIFDEVSVCECNTRENMASLESYLILKYLPKYNKLVNLECSRKYSIAKSDMDIFTPLDLNTHELLHMIPHYIIDHLGLQAGNIKPVSGVPPTHLFLCGMWLRNYSGIIPNWVGRDKYLAKIEDNNV